MQALIYGPKIFEAKLVDGVLNFFKKCVVNNISLYIVSHKTNFAAMDETGINLRAAAFSWMNKNGILNFIKKENIFFETTRIQKIKRIKDLGCEVFIDDLEEIFIEKSFPQNIQKILYSPSPPKNNTMMKLAQSWSEIENMVFYERFYL